MKTLLKYKFIMMRPFGDGEYETIYELTLLKSSFFGLFKREVTMDYTISMFGNIGQYEKHWDEMIKNGTPVT